MAKSKKNLKKGEKLLSTKTLFGASNAADLLR